MAVETKHDSIETVAAYLKLINIPCMFDMGTRVAMPKKGTLQLNLIDDRTYNKGLKPEFLSKDRVSGKKKV